MHNIHNDHNDLLKENLLAKHKWIRGAFMLLFVFIKYFVSSAINFIALFQFICTLFIGKPNDNLLEFSKGLNDYLLQIIEFLTFNSEKVPFPFNKFTH